jgi:hypothetical protein
MTLNRSSPPIISSFRILRMDTQSVVINTIVFWLLHFMKLNLLLLQSWSPVRIFGRLDGAFQDAFDGHDEDGAEESAADSYACDAGFWESRHVGSVDGQDG